MCLGDNMQSVFQTKKKPLIDTSLMSMAPTRSVAPKNQSTYGTNKSYASVNPLSSISNTLRNPTTAWRSSFAATTPTKSVFQSQPAPAPTQNSSKIVQGSGYGQNYSSNPSNYKPPVTTQTPPPPKPVVQPTLPSPHEAYALANEKLATSQAELTRKRQGEREASTKSKYQTLKEMIQGQGAVADTNFNEFKTASEADIADLRATGERQKGQAEDYYGDAQRDAAKTFRDTQGDNQRTFAGLGTIDSRGEGSFQQAAENTTSDFNRYTQQTLKAKADRFAEIDSTVSTAERQANAVIRQESVKLQDLKKQIQFALINNDQAMADELTGIANETEQTILGIQEAVTGIRYQADLEKYKIDLENQKLKEPDYDAESKLRTEYFTRTKDNKYNEVAQTYEKILNVPDTAAGDLGLIFSYMRLLDPASTVREGEFANAQNAAGVPDQIRNAWNRTLSGERLNPNQRQDFRTSALAYVEPVVKQQKEAESYYTKLAQSQGIDPQKIIGGYGAIGVQSQNTNSGGVKVMSPDGQTGTIDAVDLQEAIANGYKQI